MHIRIGIYGYGNLGRGVESAIRQNEDMELAAVDVYKRQRHLPAQPGRLAGNYLLAAELGPDVYKRQVAAPTLSFTAYAVQKAGITDVADAWAKAQAQA